MNPGERNINNYSAKCSAVEEKAVKYSGELMWRGGGGGKNRVKNRCGEAEEGKILRQKLMSKVEEEKIHGVEKEEGMELKFGVRKLKREKMELGINVELKKEKKK